MFRGSGKFRGRGKGKPSSYFDDDDDDDDLPVAAVVVSQSENDDYDPLDDFMAGIDQQVQVEKEGEISRCPSTAF